MKSTNIIPVSLACALVAAGCVNANSSRIRYDEPAEILTRTADPLAECNFDGADGWVPLELSFWPPVQLPVPWSEYRTECPWWGDMSVYGLSLGIPCSGHADICGVDAGVYQWCGKTMAGVQAGAFVRAQNAYGLQAGGVTWCPVHACGLQLGLFNYAKILDGVQIGVVNWTKDACGVQIGLWNVIECGPVSAAPILNLWF